MTDHMVIILVLALIISASPPAAATYDFSSNYYSSDDFKVPASVFVDSVKSTIQTVRDVIGIVSKFSGGLGGGDFRLSNAVADCLDLLDFSADQLTWTLSVTSQNPTPSTGKYNRTGNKGADMRTWVGGALGNQDTCMDGFEGTNNVLVKTLVAGSLNQVTSLIRDILGMLVIDNQGPSSARGPPGWLKPKDRKLIQSNNIEADAVVAADGSGQFTRIMDAIAQVPDHNSRRFVIYVKKGVYNEYVEIGKKKTNIMMIGDGMDLTIISGNHNFVDGWTTYRSATFGNFTFNTYHLRPKL